MLIDDIRKELFSLQDEKYREFQCRLLPTVDGESIIGVRTPQLRSLAKHLQKQGKSREFLNVLPHKYFDENQIHVFLISEIKDFDKCIDEVHRFLPFVDNWATCDQLSPKVFKKQKQKLLPEVLTWIRSDKAYTIRFGIKMLMEHFLDEDFDTAYPEMVSEIQNDDYYVKMMVAWYFATALAKQYKATLPFIEKHLPDKRTHNKAIQKAVESLRITVEQKEYLKTLKIK